jgi:hypothetical protein
MPLLRLLACSAVAFALLAAGVQAAVRSTRNGTYYTFDATQATVVAAQVKNGRIPTLEVMPPVSTGPGVGFIYTSAGRFARNGTWTTGFNLGDESGAPIPVCGKALSIGRLGVSFNCNSGPNNAISGRPQLVATRVHVLPPTPNTYTGTVGPTSLGGPPAGTTGTLSLTVSGGTLTGSGTFAPVDPITGIASGPPSVNVTYGPISPGTNDGAVQGSNPFYLAGGCGPTFFTRLGMFCLPSDPPGYTLIGGFVPVQIYRGGLVTGSIYTAWATGSPPSYGPALPATFTLIGPPSGGG